jgi:8-oxo-dGTP diphosphatase
MGKSEQAVNNDRYTVIPRVLIFITRPGEVLLLKGAPTKRLWPNQYNGIGGHIERGEDALSAAERELYEESGLRSIDLSMIGTILIDAGEGRGIGLYVFQGEYTGGKLVESREGSLEWIPTDRILDYPLVGDLKTLLPYVLAMGQSDPPFAALYYYDENDVMQIKIRS